MRPAPPSSRRPVVPTLRRGALVVLACVSLTGAAGCGGQEVPVEEVPGPPPTLPLPEGNSDALGEGDAEATPEGEATPAPDASGDTGSDTAQLDAFCAENPGAC